jgi:hypothetical protein
MSTSRLRLTFTRSRLLVSEYRDSRGRLVIVPHRTFHVAPTSARWNYLPTPDDGELQELVDALGDTDEALETLERLGLSEPCTCEDCGCLTYETTTVIGGRGTDREVCDYSCRESYTYCDGCDCYRDGGGGSTVDGDWRCDVCLSDYGYCERCEAYVSPYDDEHTHGCDCAVPGGRAFSVPNDGDGPLANDQEATVTLPAGTISEEGLAAVAFLLRSNDLREVARLLPELGDAWQTRQGNYPKRLSRLAYNTLKVSIPADILSAVGTTAREHSTTTAQYRVAVTRDLNLPAEEFAHESSCWWGSESQSRCTLKSNGGLALRTFGHYGVTGRAWVLPLKRVGSSLVPTFDTMTPAAYMVFNGYGELSGYAPARVWAHMTGMTYRKVGFSLGSAYVNSGGYLVAPEELATLYTDGSLYLNSDDAPEHADLWDQERQERQERLQQETTAA